MERLLVVLILLATAFAGCTAGDDLETDGGGTDGLPDEETESDEDAILAGRAPPVWAPGHHWRYTTSFGSDFQVVVTSDDGDNYYVDTPDPDTAWFHFLEQISYLGLVRKDDLAGSQGNDWVQYLSFPLEAEKTWTTTWDGVEREITVVEAGETFRLEAHEGEVLAVSYTYDPSVGWFSETTFHGPEGEALVSMSLADHQTGWMGDVYRWSAEPGFQSGASDEFGSRTQTFTVPEGLTDVWMRIIWECEGDAGVLHAEIGPLTPEATDGILLLSPECESFTDEFLFEEPAVGDWLTGYHFFAAPSASIQMDVWMRTLETVPVSA